MKTLVLIVNYNQVHEIKRTLQWLLREVSISETVLVDDGSDDGSAEIAEQMGLRVVRHGRNRGIGAAIRTGICFARENGFDSVVIFSSNGKMSAAEIQRVSGPIHSGEADYVQGSRFHPEGQSVELPWLRWTLIHLFSWLSSALLGRRFTDITCGFRAYRIDWLFGSEVNLDQPWLDRYEMEYYIHYHACRRPLRMVEVPVTIRYSHLAGDRISKIKLSRSGWSIVRAFILLPLGLRR